MASLIRFLIHIAVVGSFIHPATLGAKVLVIKWKDADFYNEAIDGFKKTVDSEYEIVDCKGSKEEAIKLLNNSADYEAVCIVGENLLKTVIGLDFKKPVVFSMVYNPQQLVSLKDNVTGASLNISFKAQFLAIQQALPKAKSVGLIYSNEEIIDNAESFAKSYGMTLKKIKIDATPALTDALTQLAKCDLILMVADPILSSANALSTFLLFGINNKIPIFGVSDKLVKSGALLGLSPSYFENGEIAAQMTNTIIKEKRIPPAKEMESGDLYLNLKRASELGIKFSNDIIKKAKAVYQ